jgi:hypothetical protein
MGVVLFFGRTDSRQAILEALHELEEKHGISSREFFERYREGKLEDAPSTPGSDYVRWASLCFAAERAGLPLPSATKA